jgi:hypothetical protein
VGEGTFGDPLELVAVALEPGARCPKEMLDEERNVLPPAAQRGNVNGKSAETTVKVLAKRTFPDQRRQVLVRGGNQANVDRSRTAGSDGLDDLLLQSPKEFPLHRR